MQTNLYSVWHQNYDICSSSFWNEKRTQLAREAKPTNLEIYTCCIHLKAVYLLLCHSRFFFVFKTEQIKIKKGSYVCVSVCFSSVWKKLTLPKTKEKKRKMKIINKNFGTHKRNLNGKINLLSWRHRYRVVKEKKSVIFAWFSIFLCSDTLFAHIIIHIFLFENIAVRFTTFLHIFLYCLIWFSNKCALLHWNFHTFSKKKYFRIFHFYFLFRLIVPSKKYFMCPFAIIYNLFYFVVCCFFLLSTTLCRDVTHTTVLVVIWLLGWFGFHVCLILFFVSGCAPHFIKKIFELFG